MNDGKEKYYWRTGGRLDPGVSTPILDYPEHNNRHRQTPLPGPTSGFWVGASVGAAAVLAFYGAVAVLIWLVWWP